MDEKLGPNNEITAEYIGVIKIGEIEIKCAVLSDEKRAFFQREVLGALTGNKKGGLERYLTAKNLQPFVPDKFKGERWDREIIRFMTEGKEAQGFEAEDLIDICNMYIDANNAGALYKQQLPLAKQAQIIVNAFAKTGVIAVVDEATGYQKYRKKDALRLLVQSYIIEEAREWMKEFPDEFFVELDRIYDNPQTTPQKRPKYYGKFINDYVYKPIENGLVLEELKKINPVNEKGNRNKRLHQFLNEEKGIQILRNRIGKVTAILQISPNSRRFKENFKRMESKQRSFEFYDDEDILVEE
jgi:hypothetical protein